MRAIRRSVAPCSSSSRMKAVSSPARRRSTSVASVEGSRSDPAPVPCASLAAAVAALDAASMVSTPGRALGTSPSRPLLQDPVDVDVGAFVVEAHEPGDLLALGQGRPVDPRKIGLDAVLHVERQV